MQIVQDFCGNSNAICEGCGLPCLLETAAVDATGLNS